ncbi:MAG: hypothetical protein HKM04_04530, partial [Legionellales bacterium]|nr:hypothetical protein [Legionellales bacterium]
ENNFAKIELSQLIHEIIREKQQKEKIYKCSGSYIDTLDLFFQVQCFYSTYIKTREEGFYLKLNEQEICIPSKELSQPMKYFLLDKILTRLHEDFSLNRERTDIENADFVKNINLYPYLIKSIEQQDKGVFLERLLDSSEFARSLKRNKSLQTRLFIFSILITDDFLCYLHEYGKIDYLINRFYQLLFPLIDTLILCSAEKPTEKELQLAIENFSDMHRIHAKILQFYFIQSGKKNYPQNFVDELRKVDVKLLQLAKNIQWVCGKRLKEQVNLKDHYLIALFYDLLLTLHEMYPKLDGTKKQQKNLNDNKSVSILFEDEFKTWVQFLILHLNKLKKEFSLTGSSSIIEKPESFFTSISPSKFDWAGMLSYQFRPEINDKLEEKKEQPEKKKSAPKDKKSNKGKIDKLPTTKVVAESTLLKIPSKTKKVNKDDVSPLLKKSVTTFFNFKTENNKVAEKNNEAVPLSTSKKSAVEKKKEAVSASVKILKPKSKKQSSEHVSKKEKNLPESSNIKCSVSFMQMPSTNSHKKAEAEKSLEKESVEILKTEELLPTRTPHQPDKLTTSPLKCSTSVSDLVAEKEIAYSHSASSNIAPSSFAEKLIKNTGKAAANLRKSILLRSNSRTELKEERRGESKSKNSDIVIKEEEYFFVKSPASIELKRSTSFRDLSFTKEEHIIENPNETILPNLFEKSEITIVEENASKKLLKRSQSQHNILSGFSMFQIVKDSFVRQCIGVYCFRSKNNPCDFYLNQHFDIVSLPIPGQSSSEENVTKLVACSVPILQFQVVKNWEWLEQGAFYEMYFNIDKETYIWLMSCNSPELIRQYFVFSEDTVSIVKVGNPSASLRDIPIHPLLAMHILNTYIANKRLFQFVDIKGSKGKRMKWMDECEVGASLLISPAPNIF